MFHWMLLVLTIAWISQEVPKQEHPTPIVITAPDTLRTEGEEVCPQPETSYQDSLECNP